MKRGVLRARTNPITVSPPNPQPAVRRIGKGRFRVERTQTSTRLPGRVRRVAVAKSARTNPIADARLGPEFAENADRTVKANGRRPVRGESMKFVDSGLRIGLGWI